MNGHDAGVGVGGQAGNEVSAVSVNAIKELVSKVAEVKEQQPPLDPRPHLQRTVVLRPLARHLDLVRTRPAHAHHQVKLRRGRRAIGARAGKAPRQQPMHLDHRRIGRQSVTQPLQHTTIAHITRREFPHQLREHCSKHPCETGSEPVMERRGDQRLARRTLIGPTKPRQGALGPGAEPEHHAPEHRAGIDFAPAPHRPAFTGQTLDLRLRQQAGQRLANTNKLDSGHGHSPDRLKLRNSNLIRGRGPLQPLVSWSITSLSEHQCAASRLGVRAAERFRGQ